MDGLRGRAGEGSGSQIAAQFCFIGSCTTLFAVAVVIVINLGSEIRERVVYQFSISIFHVNAFPDIVVALIYICVSRSRTRFARKNISHAFAMYSAIIKQHFLYPIA